jgi:hypothetical protein
MSALAAYRTAVLALLDDPTPSLYTTAQIDQALRQALLVYSNARPPLLVYNVDGSDTYRIVMPADFQPTRVVRAEYHDPTIDPQTKVMVYAFNQDSQWYVDTYGRRIAVGESLDIVYFGTLHTIDDLDSAAGTTVPEQDEGIVQLGAAGYAALMRAHSRTESNNLQPSVATRLLELGRQYLDDFSYQLKPVPKSLFATMPPLSTEL